MFDTKWYAKFFIPLVVEAHSKGCIMTPERFLEWVNKDKDRAAKHAGIKWFLNEFTNEEFTSAVNEAVEIS